MTFFPFHHSTESAPTLPPKNLSKDCLTSRTKGNGVVNPQTIPELLAQVKDRRKSRLYLICLVGVSISTAIQLSSWVQFLRPPDLRSGVTGGVEAFKSHMCMLRSVQKTKHCNKNTGKIYKSSHNLKGIRVSTKTKCLSSDNSTSSLKQGIFPAWQLLKRLLTKAYYVL